MNSADLVFYGASAAAAASTLLAVTRRSPIYSAAWMLVSLFSVGVIYLLMHATFLFVIQILLYAGAIMVLFLFVIMLLNPTAEDLALDRPSAAQMAGAAVFAVVLYGLLTKAIFMGGAVDKVPPFTGDGALQPPVAFGSIEDAGKKLYDTYLVVFEMISVLITASIAAVILLAKPRLEAGGDTSFSNENHIGGRRKQVMLAALAADEAAREVGGKAGGSTHAHHGDATPPRGAAHGAVAATAKAGGAH